MSYIYIYDISSLRVNNDSNCTCQLPEVCFDSALINTALGTKGNFRDDTILRQRF